MAVSYNTYELLDKIQNNNYHYVNFYKKKSIEANDDVKVLQKNITAFQKDVKKLTKYSPDKVVKSQLEKQIGKFVSSYNALKKNGDKVTDEEVNKQIAKLDKLFSDNAKDLSKIGLKEADGKLKFDSDVFEEAKDEVFEKLFTGKESLIRQANKILRKVDDGAQDAEFHVVEHKMTTDVEYNAYDYAVAYLMTNVGKTVSVLEQCSKLMTGADAMNEKSRELVSDCLTLFVSACDGVKSAKESGNVKKFCKDNEPKLAEVGIKVGEDGCPVLNVSSNGSMSSDKMKEEVKKNINTKMDMDIGAFMSAYKDLFGENNTFAESVMKECQSVFNSIIKPDKIGVSIIDAYA